ncbi:MAG: DUF6186 family protein [Mycobacteriales bacterium]
MGDLVWFLLLGAALALEVYARASGRVATLSGWVGGLLERRGARWLAFLGWAWLGWHLFARYTLR